MAIDTSGTWWKGSEPEDLEEYLIALSAESYPIGRFRLARCPCGSITFGAESASDAAAARRTCLACGAVAYIGDSEGHWDGEVKKVQCVECGSFSNNIGAGYVLSEDASAVKWLFVGTRCTDCEILGMFADWEVGYAPSLHLLEQA